MSYAVFSDIHTRFPPILTMVGTVAETDVTTAQVSSVYIADAESVVNAYLAGRYATPLVIEPIITQITSDLAIFKLAQDRLPRMPEYMERRQQGAISLLEMLRDGKMVLSSSQTLVTTGDNEAWSATQSYHPVFSPVLGEVEQAVDQDFVNAERDTRGISSSDGWS